MLLGIALSHQSHLGQLSKFLILSQKDMTTIDHLMADRGQDCSERIGKPFV